jgi:hypothetical protein
MPSPPWILTIIVMLTAQPVLDYADPMVAARIAFILAQILLLVVLLKRRQLRQDLRMFCWYIGLSTLVAMIPRRLHDPEWWSTWWPAQQALLLIALLFVIVEFVLWSQPGLMRREYKRLRIGLFGVLLLVLPLCWFDPTWGWLPRAIAMRQYIQLALFLFVSVFSLYLWAASVRTLRVLLWHGRILAWFIGGQAALRILRADTGLYPAPLEWQSTIGLLAYVNAALCCLAWAILFKTVAWTPTFSASALCVRFDPPDDAAWR